MNKKGVIGIFIFVGILLVGGFFLFVKNFDYNPVTNEEAQIANPASVYCVRQGHQVEIQNEDGGQIGYCVSSDRQRCEEWSFYRKECSFEGFPRCVENAYCHADGCVLENETLDRGIVMCTRECREGTMDCDAGYCAFVNGKCEVVWNEKK